MKKLVFFAVAILILASQAMAQIPKLEVFELGALAEVIVVGKVKLLEGKLMTVDVEQVVAGNLTDKSIKVAKFVNTKTAKRWGKYVVGEGVMLWLKQGDGHYEIIGANGEGEKMVFGADVYLDSRGGALKNTFGNHAPYPGAANYAEKVELATFVQAVTDTKGAFSLDIEEVKNPEGEIGQKRFAVRKLEDKEYDDLRGRSWMHESIIANGEKHQR